MQNCAKCGAALEFTGRKRKYCSDECRRLVKYERNRAWLANNPGKNAEYSRKWREANPEEAREMALFAYKKKCLKKLEGESLI